MRASMTLTPASSKISTRVRNFETAKLKVNDQNSNPIEIGAVVAATLWALISIAFRVAVQFLADYTPYGFVWGGMLLLSWFYFAALAVLIGGHVAAELERRAVGI